MNKNAFLDLILAEHEEKSPWVRPRSLRKILYEINSRKEVEPPTSLGGMKRQARLERLKAHFHSDVALCSAVLHYREPDRYILYRPNLDREICEGLLYFSDVVPEFALDFDRVGEKGFDRYLDLNERLFKFARDWGVVNATDSLMSFLYRGLGKLFVDVDPRPQAWIVTTAEEDSMMQADADDHTEWSGRKEMREGDAVFMYRMSPVKAITDVYTVDRDPEFDPYGAWTGFWVDLARVEKLAAPIPFSVLRKTPRIADWSVIRRQFQGVTVEPVPTSVFMELARLVPDELRQDLEGAAPRNPNFESLGEFRLEREFEVDVLEPLLDAAGLLWERQAPCVFHYGRQRMSCRVDYLLRDSGREVSLIEAKARIANEGELAEAVAQARSYASQMGLASFLVAAPEGFWLYPLSSGKVSEPLRWTLKEALPETLRSAVLELAGRGALRG